MRRGRLYVSKGDGVYLVDMSGVRVKIVRRKVGRHPLEHTWSNRPNWTAKLDDEAVAKRLGVRNGRTLADGHGTLEGAADGAERFLLDRTGG